ncbi:MAG: insulinase family protein, partial [Deltaproteobacteria bacterium]|nr:insulinase family protein [Deltaproteobacteria bacterium]
MARSLRSLLLACLVASAAAPALAAPAPGAPAPAAARVPLDIAKLTQSALSFSPPQVQRARLSGGASVFLLEDHDVPLVRIFLAFRGGSVHDPAEKAGLAQVTGLAWRTGGTAARPPEAFDEALEGQGIELSLSFGRDSGSASLSLLPDQVDRGLSLLSELLRTPAFRQDRVGWAVTRIAESLRREADEPMPLAFREARRALYQGHPRGTVATQETVRKVTREDVLALHGKVVEESAWAVGVVGDFRSEELLKALDRYLGMLPAENKAFPSTPQPPLPKTRLVLVPKALPQATILWARFAPPRTAPDFYSLALADYLFGSGGFQCRLAREIRSSRGLAYSVGGFYDAQAEFGILGAHAQTKKESIREVLGLVRDLTARSAAEGYTPQEVASAKESLVNRHVFKYQDPADLVRSEMGLFLDGLPLDLPSRYLPQIQAQSPEAVSRA